MLKPLKESLLNDGINERRPRCSQKKCDVTDLTRTTVVTLHTYPSVRGAALDEELRLQEGGSGKGNKAGQKSNTRETEQKRVVVQ